MFDSDSDRRVGCALAGLSDANPFLPERIELERTALGRRHISRESVWSPGESLDEINPNLGALSQRAEQMGDQLRTRLLERREVRPEDLETYEALVRYLIYTRYEERWFELIVSAEAGAERPGPIQWYDDFAADVRHFLELPGMSLPFRTDAPELFAWAFQVRRAFHHTFRRIYGGSSSAAQLRARVWQSLFTLDNRRYRRALTRRMENIPTLVVGESGTGKELVAQAIGMSRFIPFDAGTRSFAEEYPSLFHPLNIAALSPTLIESELFGHCKGAFTGAVRDREGWLELCGPRAAVFLDEIGELDASIQVKLLRVLEGRAFQRIGETRERLFRGKIIAATNRDLAREMREERFRPDFYYRLCADLIQTPPLRDQLRDAPADIHGLTRVIAKRVVGDDEADGLAEQAVAWIESELGGDYAWPGNVRELEQCVRNVLIRGEYRPAFTATATPDSELTADFLSGELTADELLRRYCTLVYSRVGTYEAAAQQLALDRRTVRSKVDPAWLARLRG